MAAATAEIPISPYCRSSASRGLPRLAWPSDRLLPWSTLSSFSSPMLVNLYRDIGRNGLKTARLGGIWRPPTELPGRGKGNIKGRGCRMTFAAAKAGAAVAGNLEGRVKLCHVFHGLPPTEAFLQQVHTLDGRERRHAWKASAILVRTEAGVEDRTGEFVLRV